MNSKALYRKGVAQYHLHDYEGAQQSLSTAQEITPGGQSKACMFLFCKIKIHSCNMITFCVLSVFFFL